jgi:acid phosphatase (class A)
MTMVRHPFVPWRRDIAASLAFACAVMLAACTSGVRPATVAGESVASGYLATDALPDSLALLPSPPPAGSPAFANDEAVKRAAFALRDTPRWTLATSDADLHFPHAAGTYECALGVPIDATDTPHLYALLQRSGRDAGAATRGAKQRYARIRPFALHDETSCAPGDEAELRHNGSYPSGHTTIGWTWALILSAIAPDHQDAILARGRAFGESRLVCNVHWQSDVLEGRFMGAATVARLQDVAAFRDDSQAAKAEIAAARAKGLKPSRDCGAESAALGQKIEGVL